MSSNPISGIIFMILLLIIIFLIFVIRMIWGIFSTSVTVSMWQNSSGAISGRRIFIWLGVMIAITLTLVMLKGRQTKNYPS
jgi:hypothetical protein